MINFVFKLNLLVKNKRNPDFKYRSGIKIKSAVK